MNKVKIAVIGIGNMGSSHCRNLFEGKVRGGELVAVCDINRERLDWATAEFGEDLATFDSFDDLLAAKICDGLIIATPHYDHPPMSIAGLEAGYHVLCEKPIGVYTKAVADLNRVASVSDKVFTVMYNQRTNPVYQKVKAMIDGGEIGEILRVNWVISDWFRSQAYYNSGGWRATWEGEGGGVLLNQCPHQLDLIQWLCGMPVRVRGFCDFGKFHDIEVEDDVTAFFEYENGATGIFITSTGESPGTNRLEISGDLGKLTVEKGQVTFIQNQVSLKEYRDTTKEGFKKPASVVKEIEVTGSETGHVGIMQNFTDGILSSDDQLSPGVEGINGLTISNAIHMSAWTDDWVSLPMDEDRFYELLKEQIRSSKYVKKVDEAVFDLSGSH